MIYDVIIIGSGPAGYTAALYTSRAFLKTLILTGTQPGGQLTTTTDVENFPGFPQGILGPKLVADMKMQVERFGTTVVGDVIKNIQYTNTANKHIKKFIVNGQETQYEAKTVIVATGASAIYLGIPSEKKFRGKGVSACATCDGFFFRGKEVVVIGGGDTAMEEATFLAKFAIKVTVIHRRDEFRASAIMLERAKKDPKIAFLTNKVVEEFVGEGVLTGVRIKDIKTGKVTIYPTHGAFLAIGHKPNTEFLNGFVELDRKGYVVTCDRLANDYLHGQELPKSKLDVIAQKTVRFATMTNVEGVFAAGDCVDYQYRQAIVAAGQGAMAAMDAEKYLEEHG